MADVPRGGIFSRRRQPDATRGVLVDVRDMTVHADVYVIVSQGVNMVARWKRSAAQSVSGRSRDAGYVGAQRQRVYSGRGIVATRRRLARHISVQALYEMDAVEHDPDACSRALGGREQGERGDDCICARDWSPVSCKNVKNSIPCCKGPHRCSPCRESLRWTGRCCALALYELLHVPATPPKVVINEAVELAKEFGGDNSGRFVNGVLGNVMVRHELAIAARDSSE